MMKLGKSKSILIIIFLLFSSLILSIRYTNSLQICNNGYPFSEDPVTQACNDYLDINRDYNVDISDLNIIKQLNNTNCSQVNNVDCVRADVNRDGIVNQDDINSWEEKLNECDIKLVVYMCGHRSLLDTNNNPLSSRIDDYLYKDEKSQWNVFVYDKNGTNNLEDVYVAESDNMCNGYEKKVSCIKISNETTSGKIDPNCGVNIFTSEGILSNFDSSKMAYYNCLITIDDTHGPKWMTVEASDKNGNLSLMFEKEYFFLNPILSLKGNSDSINLNDQYTSIINNSIYPRTFLLENNASQGGYIEILPYISGKDIYDVFSKQLICPLNATINISYFATNGAYNTLYAPDSDNIGYIPLPKNVSIIIPGNDYRDSVNKNELSPGTNMSIQFKFDIPDNCHSELNNTYISFLGIDASNSNQNITFNVPIKFNICNSNADCNDNNSYTIDECSNAGALNSHCNHTKIKCFTESDCGYSGFIGDPECYNNNLFKIFMNSTCINPGTLESYCNIKNESKLIQDCSQESCDNNKNNSAYCCNGKCSVFICNDNSDCNDNNSLTSDICVNPGTREGYCENFYISLISNVSMYNSAINTTTNQLVNHRPYIYENDSLSFFVQVYTNSGNDLVKDVYIILNEDNTAICSPDKVIDDYHKNYFCTLTVKSRDQEYGQFDIKAKAELLSGYSSEVYIEHWLFFNPVIALSIDGDMTFDSVRTGTEAYSKTMLVGNDADDSSGVPINLYISGTNFTDSVMGEKFDCPGGVKPSDISYFATNGAYSTNQDPRADNEGYIPLSYQSQELIIIPNFHSNQYDSSPNELYPGAEMAITFRLRAPQNCIGNFDQGYVIFSTNPIDNANYNVTSSITPVSIIIPVCTSNNECNDNNYSTYDNCIKPGTKESFCTNDQVACYSDFNCGNSNFFGDKFCYNTNVAQSFLNYNCINPGTLQSSCTNSTVNKLIQDCGNKSCDNFGDKYCKGNNIYNNQTCYNNGCSEGKCFSDPFINESLIENCSDYCLNGSCKNYICKSDTDCNDNNSYTEDKCVNPSTLQSQCVHNKITCLTKLDCGANNFIGKPACQNNSVFQNFINFTCINPGTTNSSCSSSTIFQLKQDCGKDYCDDYVYQCIGNNWCSNTDINKDGRVSLTDLSIYKDNYGKKNCSIKNNWCNSADINRDGKVDLKDFRDILSKFGKRDCAQSSVYESRKCYTFSCSKGSCKKKTIPESSQVKVCDSGCSKGICVN